MRCGYFLFRFSLLSFLSMPKSYFNWNSTPGEKYRVVLFGKQIFWSVFPDRHQVQMSRGITQVVRGGMRKMLWRENFQFSCQENVNAQRTFDLNGREFENVE